MAKRDEHGMVPHSATRLARISFGPNSQKSSPASFQLAAVESSHAHARYQVEDGRKSIPLQSMLRSPMLHYCKSA
jgi:hypothetical protein